MNWPTDYEHLKYANTISTSYFLEALRSFTYLMRLIYIFGGTELDPNKTQLDNQKDFNRFRRHRMVAARASWSRKEFSTKLGPRKSRS
jgi:hypothetical protein